MAMADPKNNKNDTTTISPPAPRSRVETACYVPQELLEEILEYVIDYANHQSCLKTYNADRRLSAAKRDIDKIRKILET